MLLTTALIGSHAWFCREGDAFTAPAPGVCAQEAKPGISPAFDAAWIDLGAIESLDPTVSQEEFKLWKPSLGRLVLKDLPETKQELTLKIVTNDVGPLAMESFFRSSQKLQGGQVQFNPLSRISLKGWAHFQCYDQADNLWLSLDIWCRMRCSLKLDGNPTKPEFEFYQLYSSLNTGAIV